MMRKALLLGLIIGLVFGSGPALALDSAQQAKFDHIMDLPMAELSAQARALLNQKYPEEDWGKWHFPDYVTADKTTEASYRIAAVEPALLGIANVSDKKFVVPCYCTCERFGHANLLACFWKDGIHGGAFDEHGSQCPVCMRQAFLAFLWADLGASHEEIIQGMEKKFAPLIRMHEEGKI